MPGNNCNWYSESFEKPLFVMIFWMPTKVSNFLLLELLQMYLSLVKGFLYLSIFVVSFIEFWKWDNCESISFLSFNLLFMNPTLAYFMLLGQQYILFVLIVIVVVVFVCSLRQKVNRFGIAPHYSWSVSNDADVTGFLFSYTGEVFFWGGDAFAMEIIEVLPCSQLWLLS